MSPEENKIFLLFPADNQKITMDKGISSSFQKDIMVALSRDWGNNKL
jgi:hypothetical protein